MRLLPGITIVLMTWGPVIGSAAWAESPPGFLLQWGSSGTGEGQFNSPFGVAVDAAGYVYVADSGNNRIQKFTDTGAFVSTWGSLGSGEGQFRNPSGIAVDASGSVYVADPGNFRIQKFTNGGTFLNQWGAQGVADGQFRSPRSVAADADGNVYVVDGGNFRVEKFTSDGVFLTTWGSLGVLGSPWGVTTDAGRTVYVSDVCYVIDRFTDSGAFIGAWGICGYDLNLYYPGGIAADARGNIYMAKPDLSRISKFDGTGALLSEWGAHVADGGQFGIPVGVAVDGIGNVYVSDLDNRIVKYGPSPAPAVRTTWGRVKAIYR